METQNSISRPLFAACASAALLFASSAAAQNVGIGVSNPQSKLSVDGTTSSGGLAIGDSTYTSTAGTVSPTNGAIIQGFTCIGTTKPRGRRTVVNDNGKNGGQVAEISLDSYGTSHATDFETYNARGTEAAPTNLGNGDLLGGLFLMVSSITRLPWACLEFRRRTEVMAQQL
jgi:hypothetical protein